MTNNLPIKQTQKNNTKKNLETNEWKKKENAENGKKYKINPVKKPVMKYKTKKDDQCITINKDAVKIKNNGITIYPRMFGEESLRIRNKCIRKDKKLMKTLKEGIFHDIKICKTKTNKYYICITTDEEKQYPVIDPQNLCTNDPGCKTFQTTYNPNEITEFGSKIDEQIKESLNEIDENQERIRELHSQKKDGNEAKQAEIKDKIKYAEMKHKELNEKLRNKISDMHSKTITKLLKYDIILIPRLNTKQIVEKNDVNDMTKRILNALRHGKFIKKLKDRAEQAGKIVIICSEYLTTKICDVCFEYNECKGRVYECKKCGNQMDRDMHSAKLILIKQIIEIIQNGNITEIKML